MFELFLKGLIIGFAIAAPVGPIGILCIQRSLHDGFKIGLMTGMGAALADGTYGLIAGFGLTSVSSFLIAQEFWVRIVGGLFLLYLGGKILLTKPQQKENRNFDNSPWHACGTTYLLTLTNPATILSFIAIFASFGLEAYNDFLDAIFLVLGVTLGSALWWLFLSGFVAFILHKKISTNFMRYINYISGSIIIIFALLALKILI
jgi:threonine/homoserine/homoserine lactone efflux protein